MSAIQELRSLRSGQGRRSQPVRPGARARGRRENVAALIFLAPWLLGLVGLTLGPMVVSLMLSFSDYNLIQFPEFTGLDNYTRMLHDERLLNSLRVTFVYVIFSVPLQLVFALLVALVLNRGMRGLALYRSIFYLPSLLGGSVAIAILWRQVFGTAGLVNQLLALVGIDGPGWIANPETALSAIILLNVWTFGAPMLIFLAGLRQIPTMYYEASQVDGATKQQQFLRITIPLLTPIIFFNLVLQIIGSFQSFTQAFIVSGGSGGPADSTMFYTLYLYQQGFARLDMGYASAMAWVLVLIIGGITAVNFLLSKWWVFYDD